MPKYTTADIRNIALVGSAGAGKTTLVETMLHATGVIGRVGRVEEGNTVCDYDDLEKEFKTGLDSAVVHMDIEGDHGAAHLNVIDTPGIRSYDLADVDASEYEVHFIEFVEHVPHCKFPDCTHIHEAECAVKQALEHGLIDSRRYDSYRRMYEDG